MHAVACTTAANYSFTPAKFSPGGDIPPQLTGRNIALLAAACNAQSNCTGFTSSGWLKSTLKHPALWIGWNTSAPSPCDGQFVKAGFKYGGELLLVRTGCIMP